MVITYIKENSIDLVRLNLFNHVLALFRTKFICNLAIRYLVFRWELCRGSVRLNLINHLVGFIPYQICL